MMQVMDAESSVKLRRGRISQDRKREIVAQFDLLSEPRSYSEAAAIFGVTEHTLAKILSERDETKAQPVSVKVKDDSPNPPKLKRGRLSFEKQKELLELYDQLPSCKTSEAAAKLGVKEVTLLKILSSRKSLNSRAKKRKKESAAESSSDDNDYEKANSSQGSSGLRRGPISAERRKELFCLYDKLPKSMSLSEAAAKLGVSQAALKSLLSSQESKARLSPQPGCSGLRMASRQSSEPGSSGLKMALRQGRRVRVDFSDDDLDSEYDPVDSDPSDYEVELDLKDDEGKGKRPNPRHYKPLEKQQMLAKYDKMPPGPLWLAAKNLGIAPSTLLNWLEQREKSTSKGIRSSKPNLEADDDESSSFSGEEIISYVVGSKGSAKGAQVVQFFEVGSEDHSNKSKDAMSQNHGSKPHMPLREKIRLFKKYDAMDPGEKPNAAATFNLAKSSWQGMLANRHYLEEKFRARLRKEMDILNRYDETENKRCAARILRVARKKLRKIVANRSVVEKDFAEFLNGSDKDSDSAAGLEENSVREDAEALAALEGELLLWSKQAKKDKVHVYWDLLKEKAEELAAAAGLKNFHPSSSWLKRWNKKHRVFWNQKGKLVTIYGFGENRSVSECVLRALKEYRPENVFNLVETGLYYRAIPGCCPVTNDWITVSFACNLSGDEKKKLSVVGRSEDPLSFRVMPLPLVYKYRRVPCLTEEIFCKHLQEWDRELAEADRKVALILDASTSHPNVHLDRIRLFFVPLDSSGSQPLNDRIVARAKALYRTRVAESLGNSKDQQAGRSTAANIRIVDALFALADAWDKVPKSLLVSSFLKSTFPQNQTSKSDEEDLEDDELLKLNSLDEEIQIHSVKDDTPDCSEFSDQEVGFEGRVVHMEGALNLSQEEEEDFDIDSLLQDQETTDCDPKPPNSGHNKAPDVGSKLRNLLHKSSTPNGSAIADSRGCGSPTVGDVSSALATIKKFLQLNGGTLEDLTDYTQLEIKVLSKIKQKSAESVLS